MSQTRVYRLSLNRYLVGFIIVILLTGVLFPITIPADQGDSEAEPASRGSRAPKTVGGNSIVTIKNEVYDWILIKDKAQVTFEGRENNIEKWIWVKDNGTCIFAAGTIKIKKGRLNITDNGSVLIKKGAKVIAWSVTGNCKSFKMEGGVLECENGEDYLYDGPSSIVNVHTQDAIELSEGAKIICKGKIGTQSTDENKKSNNGGDGKIELESKEYILIIDGAELNSTGGAGGQGVGDKYIGGDGGNGIINLQANGSNGEVSIQIEESSINANGGQGGYFGEGHVGRGGSGGDGEIYFTSISNDKVLIEKSTIKAIGGKGQYGIDMSGLDGYAPFEIKCKKLFVDEYKFLEGETTWFDETTYLISSVEEIRIDSPTEAKLYIPNFGKPTAFKLPKPATTSTTIELYHTLKVSVKDNSGNIIPGATVDAKLGGSSYSGTSDGNGIIFFMLLANKITKSISGINPGVQGWTVTAEYLGATGAYPGTATLPDRHNEIDVVVTLITVTIDTIKFANKPYSAQDMVVYGEVTLEGSTAGPNPIESVDLKIGAEYHDTTSIAEPEFTKWSYVWDTSEETDGARFKVEAVATDNMGFSDNDYINLTVSKKPEAPIVTILEPGEGFLFEDRIEGSSKLTLKGTVFDPNRDSKLLTHSKNVTSVYVYIKYNAGDKDYDKTITPGSGLKYDAKNKSFTWSMTWTTTTDVEWKGEAGSVEDDRFEYPNGDYTIEVTATDDTTPIGLVSAAISRTITYKRIQKPIAGITDITAVKNAKRVDVYSPVGIDTTKVFKFQSKKGASDVKLKYNLSASTDPDGNTLTYYLEDGGGIARWVSGYIIEREYIEKVDKEEVVKNYKVIIKVKDVDNEESEELKYSTDTVENLTIIIEFLPEDPPPQLPWTKYFSLPLTRLEIQILFLIMLIVFNLAAAMMIISKRKKIDKRHRARELALDSARRKQMDEESKKKEDIYAHLQFEEAAPGEKHVAMAGAAAAMALPTDEAISAGTEQQAASAEPEAPQLISVEQPVYEADTILQASPGTDGTPEATTPPQAPTTTPTPAAPAAPIQPQAQAIPPATPQPALPAQAQPAPTTPPPAAQAQPQPQTTQPKQDEQNSQ